MMATLIRLFSTRIVASKCLGASVGLGLRRRANTLDEDLRSSPSKSSKSVGLSEKNATSDPEIIALQINRTKMSPVAKYGCRNSIGGGGTSYDLVRTAGRLFLNHPLFQMK